ncbi:preprotein translocase subunit SecG [Zavarzinia compransoris]|uniref:Protein-export membrane protein SecG n=1 Tax=Zavarzinia compransoris TaxID=1264899 RepID=A0A317EBY0_9PROT|nr:preprotein translocase subunit SecG [Zavarzinia compransoris]PWR23814.1 preprotein translocase subunit SecG [Zavarzinia compransoris]TDP48047.1 protein translocase subunit secG [Zavarzinia compransoris]
MDYLLVLHLVIAVALIGVVLVQKSEGGALGIGGGGGGFMSARGAANFLTRLTGILAAIFMLTSLGLTILANSGGSGSIVDRIEAQQAPTLVPSDPAPATPAPDASSAAPESVPAPAETPAAPAPAPAN